MRRPTTRRTLLATLGAASTFSLAGCSGIIPAGPNSDSETTSTSTDTPDGSETTSKGTTTPSGPGGSVIDDFEGNLDRWTKEVGDFTKDTKKAYKGSQSLVLQQKKKKKQKQVTIKQSFFSSTENKALDLSKHDLSLAVRFEKPIRGRIQITCDTSAGSVSARRFIPKELNGWTRFDLGYTGKQGSPDLSSVFNIQISVIPIDNKPKPIKVGIDDLRKIPKADKGKVMFQFDDSVKSAYDLAFPMFKKRDWQAGVAIMPVETGTKNRLSMANMREMASANWDMMSHTSTDLLPTQSKQKQKQAIEKSKAKLTSLGFKRGARHFVAPNGRVEKTTLDIIRNNHKTNFLFGGGPGNAKQPTNMYTIPRVMGASPDAVIELLDLAEKFNQLLVIQYHKMGKDEKTTPKELEKVVKHVEKKKMDVVSPSQFLDSIGN